MTNKRFSKAVIVGLGLIGGSLGKALLKNQICHEIWGTDTSTPVLIQGLEDGAITNYSESKAETFRNAELVIIAAPVDKIIQVLEECMPYIPDGALVTDTGSVKEKIVTRAISLAKDRVEFIGGHPMAGSEKEGISAANAELLVGHTYIFTPHKPLEKYNRLNDYIQAIKEIGMEPEFLKPDEHDRIVANLSHLPHLIAAVLMTSVGTKCTPTEMKTFTGNGLKDTTRISAGSPELWSQILTMNRANILNGLDKFKTAINILQQSLQNNDVASVKAFLAHASATRTRLTAEEEHHE